MGFGAEGDRELIEAILEFSRLLLDKCGNRSLFSSSERLNDLLNTTSLSLLQCVLRIGVNLAQRYYSRQRTSSSSHFHQTLLATHYNIDLERVQKLAAPFPRPTPPSKPSEATSTGKGKGKSTQNDTESNGSGRKCNANDLISLTGANLDTAGVMDASKPADSSPSTWEEWGNVRFSYYLPSSEQGKLSGSEGSSNSHAAQPPSTPTPLRRSATHPSSRLARSSALEHSPSAIPHSPTAKADESARGMKVLEIPSSTILTSTIEQVLQNHLEEIPRESRYEFLNKLRIAYGVATSQDMRRQMLAIRILAVTNLAYIYPDLLFQQRILQPDSDEPKRLQLAYQLAELVHLGLAGDIDVSTLNQTFALYALDALAKHKSRSTDVCAALNVNVNHGILLFITRKAVADLAVEDPATDSIDADDWRDALLGLLRTLPSSGSRTAESLVSAGLIQMFVDVLNIRTEKARRVYPRATEFIDTFVHSARDALTSLASAKGFDAISDLISVETKTAFDLVEQGSGIPTEYRTQLIDYQIPYFHQQSLRWLFKFVNHVMTHTGGGFERLLRNLIDSPPLLRALRLVMENSRVYGSHIWSGAVNIMSNFIHNEPTSYAIIAEAGLSKSFLEATMDEKIEAPSTLPEGESPDDEDGEEMPTSSQPLFVPSSSAPEDHEAADSMVERATDRKLAGGILPSTEAILCVPQAFGAICLNSSGLRLFQTTNALEQFFDIFESPEHVKCMKNDSNLLRILGNSFDELVRHHPALKSSIMSSILLMVARVGRLCRLMASERGIGTKLFTEGEDGKLSIAGGSPSLSTKIGTEFTSDGNTTDDKMDISGSPVSDAGDLKDQDSNGLTVANYIFPVVRFLSSFFENQSLCANYIESGGVEYVVDFATLPSLPFDFHNTEASQQLSQVIHLMIETKPHLVLPSLVARAQEAVDIFKKFWEHPDQIGYFFRLTNVQQDDESSKKLSISEDITSKGTYLAKHLVAVHTLTDILREAYTPPIYPTRPSQLTSPFIQVNLADKYEALVSSLSHLHAACVWEEILLQKHMPESWNDVTKVAAFGNSGGDANEVPNQRDDASDPGDTNEDIADGAQQGTAQASSSTREEQRSQGRATKPSAPSNEKSAQFRNVKILRYLLSSLPSSITAFLHLLGHGLVGKRRIDTYQRQNSGLVADAIASGVLKQLNFFAFKQSICRKDQFSYLIVILSSFSQLLFNSKYSRYL